MSNIASSQIGTDRRLPLTGELIFVNVYASYAKYLLMEIINTQS